jgi:large conductance mechanosensitive channel
MRAIARVRSWFEEQTGARGIVVGVVLGFALLQLFEVIGRSVLLPLLMRLRATTPDSLADIVLPAMNGPLTITVAGIEFDYSELVVAIFALLLVAAAVWIVFIMPLSRESRLPADTRECPECKTNIWIDATRCAACRIPVEPLPPPTSRAPEPEWSD